MENKTTATLKTENGVKKFRSESYNYNFDLTTGFFQRWGKTQEDDPNWSPFGPEIMDIEISEGKGCPIVCPFCYKGNSKGNEAVNMSFKTFKTIFKTFPKTITQIAFGITSVGSHPELFDIFEYCRINRVIPNVTVNGSDPLTDYQVKRLVGVCGAMAISVVWPNQEKGFDLIKRLTDAGLKQANIHFMISKQTIGNAYEVCKAIKNDPRLAKLNAIVFLGLKPKARGQSFDVLPTDEYVKLVNYCLENEIPFGFDSCSCCRFMESVKTNKTLSDDKKEKLMECAEPCESGLFSAYIDASGKYWHCSFGENREDSGGMDVTKIKDFTKEIWYHPKMTEWRTKLISIERECPLYPEIRVKY